MRSCLYRPSLSRTTPKTPAAKKDPLAGIKCPVSGKAVTADSKISENGVDTYFCCNNCPKAYKADPAKFATKANHQHVATGQFVQIKCPLTGKPCKADQKVKIDGVEVAFCCGNCKGKAEKATGDEQLGLAFADKAFKIGFEKKKAKDEKGTPKFNLRHSNKEKKK